MLSRLTVISLILALSTGLVLCDTAPAQAQADSTTVSADTTPPPAKAPAKAASAAGPFARGSKRGGIYGGAGSTLGNTYVILGVGLAYFIHDGLEIGVDAEGWLFQDPTIWKVSPQVRYTVWQMGKMRPYVGAFWRRTFVSDPYDDVNSWGGRAGLTYASGRGYAGVGVVYEKFDDDFGTDSDSWYPEVSFSVYF
ncbi:hypothetical protein DRQ53_14495 [bacterium]|nr:MAG: hypothetical protein DRQ53_14495 [bacterium]